MLFYFFKKKYCICWVFVVYFILQDNLHVIFLEVLMSDKRLYSKARTTRYLLPIQAVFVLADGVPAFSDGAVSYLESYLGEYFKRAGIPLLSVCVTDFYLRVCFSSEPDLKAGAFCSRLKGALSRAIKGFGAAYGQVEHLWQPSYLLMGAAADYSGCLSQYLEEMGREC